jgi:uncharacterized protein YxjI
MNVKSLIVEQKITAFANQYIVYETDTTGAKGVVIAFAHQKRLAFKEEVLVYTDETKSQVAFTIKAENVLDYHGRFFVKDSNAQVLGTIRKDFKSSLLRSTWEIGAGDNVICKVVEASKEIAILRRLWGFVPYIGELPFFLKYHFDFISPQGQQRYGRYTKTKLFYDHYKLDIVDEQLLQLTNWQTLVAQAILLDALQGR